LNNIHIVLATYFPNQIFFHKQILSIKNQTNKSWSCTIVDDGSDVASVELIKSQIVNDSRFQLVVLKKNEGCVAAFSKGLELIRENIKFVLFCDQDDIWLPHKIDRMLKEFDHEKVMLVHSDLKLINEKDDVLYSSCWEYEKRRVQENSFNELLFKNNVTGCSCMFRSELISTAAPIPTFSENYFFHDHWIALHASLTGSVKTIFEPLVYYRQHSFNLIGANRKSPMRFKINNVSLFYQERLILYKAIKKYVGSSFFTKTTDFFLLKCNLIKKPIFSVKFFVSAFFYYLKKI